MRSTVKYHPSITRPSWPESQQREMSMTRGDAVRIGCARGDLNRAQPTLVLPE
jgi:hypothetical protein